MLQVLLGIWRFLMILEMLGCLVFPNCPVLLDAHGDADEQVN